MVEQKKTDIHPSAVIDPTAQIGEGVEIGAYCIVGAHTKIGNGTILEPHAIIQKHTMIGANCHIHSAAILGGPPQDMKYKGEESYVILGDNNIVREFVTIHRAVGEFEATRIGNGNMLMAYVHIGHNCEIWNNVHLASYVGLSGHVTVYDNANVGGITGVHQFCRIGRLSMTGGLSGVAQDIPPYMLANGRPARVYDVNVRGLRRAGITSKVRAELREAYKLIYRSNLNTSQALEAIEAEIEKSPELDHLVEFIRSIRGGYGGRGNNPQPL